MIPGHWYLLNRQFDRRLGPCIALYARRGPSPRFENLAQIPIAPAARACLGVTCDGRSFQFRYAAEEDGPWLLVGEPQDALVLSDEFVEMHDPVPTFGFTGAHIGLVSFDMTDRANPPAFDWFEYKPIKR